MLGKIGWHLHNHPGVPCGCCDSGWPRGRRAQKRREHREWKREVNRERVALHR